MSMILFHKFGLVIFSIFLEFTRENGKYVLHKFTLYFGQSVSEDILASRSVKTFWPVGQ